MCAEITWLYDCACIYPRLPYPCRPSIANSAIHLCPWLKVLIQSLPGLCQMHFERREEVVETGGEDWVWEDSEDSDGGGGIADFWGS